MEQPFGAATLSSFLSIQKALKAVREERKGNQLGCVAYRPKQLEEFPDVPADWESACKQQCGELGIDFAKTKGHLEWATALAGSIDRGQKAFCYGAVHRFLDHDVRHAKLLLSKPKLESGAVRRYGDYAVVSVADFEMASLLLYCTPAPFGDLLTESTKLDTNVRRALEAKCKVVQPDSREYPRPIFEHHLRKAVEEHLSHGQDVNLVPYKLNIYGEGDFFKPHTDTPVNPRLFIGTVVVCLPSKFSGGELLVSHGDTCQTFDFAAKSGEPGIYQFATFYGDCLHEIKPVKQGRRVTLTYHVLRKEAGDTREDEAWYPRSENGKVATFALPNGDAVPKKLHAELTSELRALRTLGYPHVGFLLQHEYTMSGLSPQGLKGGDQSLFDLFSGAAWPCRLLPVLVVDEARQHVADFEEIEYSRFSRNVYAFTKQDFQYYTGATDAKPDHGFKSAIPFMLYGAQPAGRVLDQRSSAGGQQGNHSEPSEDQTFYLQSAMVVDLSCKKMNSTNSLLKGDKLINKTIGDSCDL